MQLFTVPLPSSYRDYRTPVVKKSLLGLQVPGKPTWVLPFAVLEGYPWRKRKEGLLVPGTRCDKERDSIQQLFSRKRLVNTRWANSSVSAAFAAATKKKYHKTMSICFLCINFETTTKKKKKT